MGLGAPISVGYSLPKISSLDTPNFSLSLSRRRDRAFYSFRQLCLFLRNLAKRVVLPAALPEEEDIASILDLNVTTAPALSVTLNVNRTEFGSKLDHACKLKAEVEQHELKGDKPTIEELKEKAKVSLGVLLLVCSRRPAVTLFHYHHRSRTREF